MLQNEDPAKHNINATFTLRAFFGIDQAVIYVSDFDVVFHHLAENPKLGRERNEIRSGLRSLAKESHIIFYRIWDDGIRIVRVLHASRDILKFIPPAD